MYRNIILKIKSKIKAVYSKIKYFTFLKSNALELFIIPPKTENAIDIVTIAFNNDMVILYQILLIKKYLEDEYCHTIIDNSSDLMIAKKIKKICLENQVGYIKLRKNSRNLDPSTSHGTALNWAYYNFIMKRKLKYFGFLDHDIYPKTRTSIIAKLKQSACFGFTQERDDRWYLWPGFSFFSSTEVGSKRLNFLPVNGLDTGGSNWSIIYKNIDKEKLAIPNHQYIKLNNNLDFNLIAQVDLFEEIGDWMHSINASNWSNQNIEKIKTKNKELEAILKDLVHKH